jgi:fucose permease
MGMLTALYGIGQIAGPPTVGRLIRHAANVGEGFDAALAIASATLILGAIIYSIMIWRWPVDTAGTTR